MLESQRQIGLEGLPVESAAATGRRAGAASLRVAFLMPRCSHEHVRGVHKQALSLATAGFDVDLLVRPTAVREYLGMRVVGAKMQSRSPFKSLLLAPRLLAQALGLQADVYVLRNPDMIPLALAMHAVGRNVIYDTQEDFSKRPLIRDRVPRILRPVLAWCITRLERILARLLPCVIVSQAQQPETMGGRTLLLRNAPLVSGPVYDEIRGLKHQNATNMLRLLYAGEISRRRGLDTMLELVAALNERQPCRLRLLGSFNSQAEFANARCHSGWQYVDYGGLVPHDEALGSMRDADIGLAILDAVADFPTSSITKLYEYMEAGLPFIASDFPAWRVATNLGAPGMYIDPASFEQVRSAAIALADDSGLRQRMGRAGREYIANEFNWDLEARPFVELVRSFERGVNCRASPNR